MKILLACALLLTPVCQALSQEAATPSQPATGSSTTFPIALSAPPVKYPKGAPKGRYVVQVAFTVDEQGVPRHPHIVRSDNEYFDFSAMVTALQWRFKPAMRDGSPVATPLTLSLAFDKETRWRE
jgi:periplasmic protein TonB